MLNGSKTYLISFTALFNKKGYELALGVDTLIDVLRDTQYHLTAPAYSTYNTLKLDVMKTATKSPYSATSLFGNGLREALISTEMEGVGIETVHTNIVFYLSEIQRHFSGESRVDARSSSTHNTYSERVDKEFLRLDIEIKAESISDALLEATDVAETILNAECSNFFLTDNVRNIEINDMTFNTQNDMTYETSIEEDIESIEVTLFNSDSSDVSSGGEKVEVVWDTEHCSGESATKSDGESALIPLAIGAARTTDIKDASINSFELGVYDHVYELERIEQSSPSKLYQGHHSDIADYTPVDYDSRGRSAWVDYTTLADSGVDVDSTTPDWLSIGSAEEKYVQADVGESTDTKIYGDIEDGLIGESEESNLLYPSEGSSPLEFTSCSNEFQMDAEAKEMSAAKLIKDVIADSPEVGRMARLLEIMYGHKAFEMIQAGMNNLVDSYVQDMETADPISITDAVIQQLEEALGGTTVYTDNASMEYGVLDSHRDGVCDTIEGGEKNTGGEGTLQNIGEAMSAADNRMLSMQETETGFIFNFDEGVNQDIERGNSENSIGSVVAETETAEVSTQYEFIDQPIESATWAVGFDAVENDELVQAEGGNSLYESVDRPIEQGSKYTSCVAVEESTVFAGQEITVEAITTHDEHADHVSTMIESIEHKLESAVAGKGNEATLAEDEGAMGAISYEAVNSDNESAYIEGGNTLSVVEEQEQGQLSGGPIQSIVDEGTGAEAITVTEFADVSHITEGSRKRRVIPTNIENAGESTRTKVIETAIVGGEEGARVKEAIPTNIENAGESTRTKVIETVIVGGEEGARAKEAIPTNIENAGESARTKVIETVIVGGEEGARVKEAIPTNIENAGESTRTKVIETVIAGGEEGARVKEAIPTEIEKVVTGQRPHKVIETTIEKPSEAGMLTPEAPKKPKIWLILGKVASWSIWNWKKTR